MDSLARILCVLSALLTTTAILPVAPKAAADATGAHAERIAAVPLETLDDARFDMTNFGERTGTVVVFLSGRCLETERQIGHIESLHEENRHKGILFVGVVSNPAESGDEIRIYCQRRGVRFPVCRDPKGAAAALFEATVTPEAFLIDNQGHVIYRGAVDDSHGGTPLADAILALRDGRDVAEAAVAAVGTPLAHPGPAREVDDPYGAIQFESELVFAKAHDTASHHCSTLAEAPNGDLLCSWYGGSYESADDQTLFLARRRNGTRRWDEPEVLIRDSLNPPGNGVVFVDPRGRIWIVWGRMETSRPVRRGGGWGECRLFYRISADNGRTWSEDVEMPHGNQCLPRAVPLRLSSGELLLPLNGHVDGQSGSVFLITADAGETWEPSSFLPSAIQPTLVERRDGSLLAYMRSRPRIMQSESSDQGRTWSKVEPTSLKCPNASVAMTKLTNGHLVLVFNDSEEDRTPLSIARSLDDGKTWEKPLILEGNPGEYSYPCVIQTSDGLIHASYTFRRYTIKHVTMNEDWLAHLERPN